MKKLISHKAPPEYIAISVIEDNAYLRSGWRAVLEDVPDFLILDDYSSCEEALQAQEIGESDVILMDIGLPGISGIEGVKILSEMNPSIAIIMITIHDDDRNVFEAICAGAVGYLLKSTTPEQLIQAIRDAHAGGSPMTPNIARKVIASFQKSVLPVAKQEITLSEQEQQVLAFLAEGKSYVKIADLTNLSVHGVRYHLRHIYEKLHVQSRAEAVAVGLKKRIIQPPR